jgi:hypothetical protein
MLRMPVDVDLVKAAIKRPKPIEPEKFAELRAGRRRCKLGRVQAAPYAAFHGPAHHAPGVPPFWGIP